MVGTTSRPGSCSSSSRTSIDKRITPRWINYERLDTCIGAVDRRDRRRRAHLRVGVRVQRDRLLRPLHERRRDRRRARSTSSDSTAGAFFAVVLLNASLIGAGALTLSTSYAFGDVFGTKLSLHRSFSRCQGLLRDLRRADRRRGRDRPDPRRAARGHHRGGPGARGRAAPRGNGVPAAAVQRTRRARAVAQRPVAERARGGDRRRAGAALDDPDADDRLPRTST